MSPSDIEVLIHCHVEPAPHPRANAPAVRRALHRFEYNGLIKNEGDGVYSTTRAGAEHIAKLCNTPVALPDRYQDNKES